MNAPEVERLLEAHGITPTAQRVDIARVLLAAPQHLSADQVLARLHVTGAPVSKATVYNTLGLFAARGLIRQVIVDPTKVFFDSNTAAHHHFYNADSGELTDIDRAALVTGDLPEPPAGTEIAAVDVIIRVRARGA
ncbi:MAG: Fur family transcriptional regulator [Gammaproteobacteria bacterium]